MNRTPPKTLGIWICTALVVGNMIGSGIFLLPASLASFGTVGLAGWFLTAGGALLLAMIFARLARSLPRAGGPYAFAREGFGDFIGFLVAWGYWISICAGNSAIAVALVGYLGWFIPALAHNNMAAGGCALALVWGLTAVNATGIRQAGLVQLVTTGLKLLPLVLIAGTGLFFIEPAHFTPLNPSGDSAFSAVTATATLTLWAFMGLESATIPAAHVKDAERTIPKATVMGVILVTIVYVLCSTVVMGVVPRDTLMHSTAPFAEAAQSMWGTWAGHFVAAGALFSTFGALNGWIMMQSQIPMAVARDGLFPEIMGRLNRNGVPYMSLIFSSLVVTLLISANYSRSLVELYTFSILLSTLNCLVPYLFAVGAEWIIRSRYPDRFPKSTRLTIPGSLLAFGYVLWAISGSGHDAVYWGFLLLMCGVPIYALLKFKPSEES